MGSEVLKKWLITLSRSKLQEREPMGIECFKPEKPETGFLYHKAVAVVDCS